MKTVQQLLEQKAAHRAQVQAKRRQKRREREERGYKPHHITQEPGYKAFMQRVEDEKGC